ncbi:peroxide stress protein YaaA [Neolewinella lacunae]|uniref:UPF0246 protein H9S92_17835 n=1 Tax=Neolewinella lacunae TaxID=1517758 RepID=A0A923PP69_9BACT|nr:peroxide stress protein YaaA [Neolewinella lacunae]MBC6996035.1 peroxide stress protein YaaA [Neolewinella lacunae]MDN3635424.1 peroxide stress protein YaaA [Neolewinella lacunae]
MLVLLSPAKTLDMAPVDFPDATQPRLLDDSARLVEALRKKSRKKLAEMMDISPNLAELNYQRYQDFSLPLSQENAKPALFAFRGDVYQDLEADDFSPQERDFANRQLRILSGLYGLLRPYDLMAAYRLEMGTSLTTRRGKNLYAYWGDRITQLLNEDLAAQDEDLVLNLASQEYFKSVRPEKLRARLLTVHFREAHQGGYRVVAFNAKRARGRMANLITREGITTAEPLRELVVNDYHFRADLSAEADWVWVRE